MTREVYKCEYHGCTAKTIFADHLCRIHRRNQLAGDSVNVTSVNEALKNPASSGWAMSALSDGRKLIANKPQAVYAHVNGVDAFAITKYALKSDHEAVSSAHEVAARVGGNVGSDGDYVSLAAPIAPGISPIDMAKERYASYTYKKLGSNPKSVEQYDDPGEAISNLDIPGRYGDRMNLVYMTGSDFERVRIYEGSVNIVARISPKDNLSVSEEGVIYQEFRCDVESFKNGEEDMQLDRATDELTGILTDVCYIRETIESYKFQVPGHEGSSEFYIPVGWTDIPRYHLKK